MHDWKAWRTQQRAQLIARRKEITATDHRLWSHSITTLIQQGFPELRDKNIAIYWPIHGEFDPRPCANYFLQQGVILALPVVIDKKTPLYFKKWWFEAPMKKGAYGIPTPDNTEKVTIDIIMIPMLGFDLKGYRIGYGSGYYDRTLAALQPRPLVIGIAFEISRLSSVYPQPHDIAMDYIVTEASIFKNNGGTLIVIETA